MKYALCAMFLLVAAWLGAGVVQQTYTIPQPTVQFSDGWHHIGLDGGIVLTDPGMPELPAWPVSLLLPPGEKVVSVELTQSEPVSVAGGLNVYPQQIPVPLSRQQSATFTAPNAAVYEVNSFWPAVDRTAFHTQYLRGHSIALLNLWPVKYNPVSGELTYVPQITVTVTTAPDAQAAAASEHLRSDNATCARLNRAVDNPSALNEYPADARNRLSGHLLVIITDADCVDYFNDFVDFKTKQGYNPLVMTVADINAGYDGVDEQDRIRNFIEYCYNEYNTEFVILGGDVNIVPCRGMYLDANGTIDEALPADMYYSCLDRVGVGEGPDWNTDNDNYWGEPYEADFYPELAVGRICAGNATEFANALNKQIMYQLNPVSADAAKALMVGEQLNDSPVTWGGTYKDEIANGGTYNGYTTTGVSSNFTINTLYERDGYWGRNQLQNQMNTGVNLINHLGHSNTDYNMKFSNGDVTASNITSDGQTHGFFLIYSQGCYASAFDESDAISEKFTNLATGCVCYVGNSRYGWYSPGATNSSSQFLDRQYYDAIFGEGVTRVGEANDDSKLEAALHCTSDVYYRWACYEVNVLGDPSLDVWTATPQTLNPTYLAQIPLTSTYLAVQAGAPDALICATMNGQQIASVYANAAGNAILNFSEPFSNLGTIDLYITAHDYRIHTGTVEVISADQPYFVVDDYTLSAGDNDQLDFGESATLSLTIHNIGSQPSGSATVTLSSGSSYITFTDATESIAALAANSTVNLTDAFAFSLAANVPDGTLIPITVSMSDGSYSWSPSLTLEAHAPELALDGISIMGSDGLLDPGETADVKVWLANNGSADLHALAVSITTSDPYITLNSSTGDISLIAAGQQNFCVFNVTVADNAPNGYMAGILLSVDAEQGYDFNGTCVLVVGVIADDFESGDLSAYDWTTSGSADWYVTNGAYQGSYCVHSGNIGDNQTTSLSISLNVLQAGELSFWYKVSCENSSSNDYDYLVFYIDGQEQGRWDGEVSWSNTSFDVSEGSHSFTWTYSKDGYVSSGSDCAWIDLVQFPPFVGDVLATFFLNPESLNFGVVPVGQSLTRSFSIFNMGEATMQGTIEVPDGFTLTGANTSRSTDATRDGRMDYAYTIEPSNFSQMQLIFAPTAEGNYSTGIYITSNDPYHAANLLNVTASTYELSAGDDNPAFADALLGNHPNPFNPETTVAFSVAADRTPVRIDVYNVRGQRVTTLQNGAMDAGLHSLVWRGTDDTGRNVGSGVYFCRTQIGAKTFINKMLMLK